MTDLSRLGPYGEAPGSVMASLNKMNRRQRVRYYMNVRRHNEDRQALEQWASTGFTSSSSEGYGVNESETKEVYGDEE